MTDPSIPSAPTVTHVDPHTQNSISSSQATIMALWAREDLAAGKISAEQAEQIFNELHTPLEARQPDQRSDEQRRLDAAFRSALVWNMLIQQADRYHAGAGGGA